MFHFFFVFLHTLAASSSSSLSDFSSSALRALSTIKYFCLSVSFTLRLLVRDGDGNDWALIASVFGFFCWDGCSDLDFSMLTETVSLFLFKFTGRFRDDRLLAEGDDDGEFFVDPAKWDNCLFRRVSCFVGEEIDSPFDCLLAPLVALAGFSIWTKSVKHAHIEYLGSCLDRHVSLTAK